jgi:hypothetical protein
VKQEFSPTHTNYGPFRRWIHDESVRELAVQRRILSDDEINEARAMVGWQFWAGPIIFVVASVVSGSAALARDPVAISLFLLFASLDVILWIVRIRDYRKITHDIEMRVAEVIAGAPERVWMQRNTIHLSKLGFCYLQIAGRTIRVPTSLYGELREANIVKIAFLPRALVATRVESERGLGGFSA